MPKQEGFYVSGVGLTPEAEPLPPGLDLRGIAMARVHGGLPSDPLLARLAVRHATMHNGHRRSARDLERILAVLTDPAYEAPREAAPRCGS